MENKEYLQVVRCAMIGLGQALSTSTAAYAGTYTRTNGEVVLAYVRDDTNKQKCEYCGRTNTRDDLCAGCGAPL